MPKRIVEAGGFAQTWVDQTAAPYITRYMVTTIRPAEQQEKGRPIFSRSPLRTITPSNAPVLSPVALSRNDYERDWHLGGFPCEGDGCGVPWSRWDSGGVKHEDNWIISEAIFQNETPDHHREAVFGQRFVVPDSLTASVGVPIDIRVGTRGPFSTWTRAEARVLLPMSSNVAGVSAEWFWPGPSSSPPPGWQPLVLGATTKGIKLFDFKVDRDRDPAWLAASVSFECEVDVRVRAVFHFKAPVSMAFAGEDESMAVGFVLKNVSRGTANIEFGDTVKIRTSRLDDGSWLAAMHGRLVPVGADESLGTGFVLASDGAVERPTYLQNVTLRTSRDADGGWLGARSQRLEVAGKLATQATPLTVVRLSDGSDQIREGDTLAIRTAKPADGGWLG